MKLIHLSDLHLGKRLGEVSLCDDQSHILNQILTVTELERPDAVLIAGDVYDKSVPPAEAVTLFDGFLSRLAALKTPVLIISGNHDSPERLAFGGRLMAGAGIHVSPVYDGAVTPVTLEDEFGPVDLWLLPFVKPIHVRRCFPETEIESYTDAVRTAIGHMEIDRGRRNVLVTHQFVTGAERCESEEISVGGSDNVDASVFDGFAYVALGHIHGPQNIGSNRVRYCGTPLKYSFSEAHHQKSITVAELSGEGEVRLRTVPLHPKRDLRQLRGSFSQLMEKAPEETDEDYLHILLTDEEDVPEALGRLRVKYGHILKLSYDNTRTRTDRVIEGATDVRKKSPMELFDELYELQNNRPMDTRQRSFVRELMEKIWEAGT